MCTRKSMWSVGCRQRTPPPPPQASHTVLWHGLSELQVLLRLDLEQTASARKETMIKTLILKGALKAEVN